MSSKLLKGIKKLSVEFIILIFIMGFFSSTVSNFFLPEIYASPIGKDQNITKSIPLNGSMEPKKISIILLNEDVVVKEFFVEVGDTVEVGDPIFEIDETYNNSIETKEEKELYLMIENEELDKEKLKLNLEMKEKDIQKIIENIDKQEEGLKEKIELYEIGSIPYMEITKVEEDILSLEDKLEAEKVNYKALEKETEVMIKNADNNIQNIRKDIRKLREDDGFYSKVSSDGIYYSEVKGTIFNISNTRKIIRREENLVEIAIVDDYTSVKFVGYIDERDNEFIELGQSFNVDEISTDRQLEAIISNKSRVTDNGKIKVEAHFHDGKEIGGDPLIGSRLEGKISKQEEALMIIPKTSIIPMKGFIEGESGKVYIIDEKEGLLGTKYFAKEVIVTMSRIGDTRVEVLGIEGYEDRSIITNLSYKIRDGVRLNWE